MKAVLRSRVEDSDRIVADLTFSGDDGTVLAELEGRPAAMKFYESTRPSREDFEALGWSDIAAIRILDYVDNAGRETIHGPFRVERPARGGRLAR